MRSKNFFFNLQKLSDKKKKLVEIQSYILNKE